MGREGSTRKRSRKRRQVEKKNPKRGREGRLRRQGKKRRDMKTEEQRNRERTGK